MIVTTEQARKIASRLPLHSAPICFSMLAAGKGLHDRGTVGAVLRCSEEELAYLHGKPTTPKIGRARADYSNLRRWAKDTLHSLKVNA